VEKRLVAFLLLSTALMAGWMLVLHTFGPKQPPAPLPEGPGVAEVQPGQDDPQRPEEDPKQPGEEPVGPPDEVREPADGEPLPTVKQQWVTLGSVDPSDPYRLLVTLTNRGAAVERIEISDPRFRDIEDRSGYLGHLVAEPPEDGPGVRVNVVGRGTPAAKATCKTSGVAPGLKVGDVILSAGGFKLGESTSLEEALSSTKPRQLLPLKVRREIGGQQQTLDFTATLMGRPLEVVRPEMPDPRDRFGRVDESKKFGPEDRHAFSFLTTIEEIGPDGDSVQIATNETEIADLPSLFNGHWEILPQRGDSDAVSFRFVLTDQQLEKVGARGPVEVIKTFRLKRVPSQEQQNRTYRAYHLDYELEIHNLSDTPQTTAYRQQGPTGLPLEGWWYSNKIHPQLFKAAGTRDVIFSLTEGKHRSFNLIGCPQIVKQQKKHPDDPETLMWRIENAGPLRYAGGDAQYFSAVLMRDPESEAADYVFPKGASFVVGEINGMNLKRTNVTYRLTSETVDLAPGESLQRKFVIFAGPKVPELLSQYDLDNTIVYGWFGLVSQALLEVLHFFYWLTGSYSYGIAIIMLTVLVRACMFPLSRKQVMSAQKMQELAPELKKIGEKYKDDMQKKGAAQQELFRKHNYNPLGGCLLVFFQLPIFIGLYRCLSVDIELRQAPLIRGLQWASNLAAPDQLWHWEHAFPEFFDRLVGANGFLGPYLNILPLITVVLFLLQQKLFTPPPTDEQQKMQQQMMSFMMLFIGVLFFRVPAGLCIYFIVSSLWGLGERKLLPKIVKKSDGTPEKPAKSQAEVKKAKSEASARKAKRKKAKHRR
jgi:YidC/Oxa1 family membrane protein insertase